MKKKIMTLPSLCILSSIFLLTACHKQNKSTSQAPEKSSTIITVKPKSQTLHLYYKGKIAPISVYSILSPVAGHISKLGFSYGDPVKKGQLIATISADDLADTYQKQLADYISKKDAMEMAGNDYTSAMSLYNAGVETQYNVSTARSAYNNSILALNTSKHALAKTTALLGIDMKTLEGLTLRDVAKVTKELNKKFKNITVHSSYNGVALHPLPSTQNNSSNNSDDNNNKVAVGGDIKQKQLLLSVGDLDGYSTRFNVSEVDIHHFKIGQKVLVTGPAFPHTTLVGRISAVAFQANASSSSGSMAQFGISAKIPHVTSKQSNKIDIGMSTKIDVPIITQPEISVPINALSIKNGQTVVQKIDAQGQTIAQPVTVGTTMVSSATILSGLKSGDRVVVPNH
jgi:multidrug efflux pump subunit AcrA (membrane-fusion protein)